MSATAVLSEAGFSDAQVRALAEYFDEQMATKADIAKVRRDIEKVRADLELKIAALDVRIADARSDTIKWVAGLMIAQGAAMVALVKLLPGLHS